MFLLSGVLLIALAAVFLLVHLLDVQGSAGPNGPATKITWWEIGGFLLGLAVVAWLALINDLLFAGRREEQPADEEAQAAEREAEPPKKGSREENEIEEIKEIKEIAAALRK
jgi:hypothetical protein